MRRPERRSMVSSAARAIGQSRGRMATIRPSRTCPAARQDQASRFRTRWDTVGEFPWAADRPERGQDRGPCEAKTRGPRPSGRIRQQYSVVVGEVPLLAEPHDPQDRTDGAVAGRQEGSNGQELGLDPDAVGGQWSEGGQDGYDLRWQIQGGRSPRTIARMSPSIVANDPLDLPADLAKIEGDRGIAMAATGEDPMAGTEGTGSSPPGPSSGPPQFEFQEPENALIRNLAWKMHFVGLFGISIGLLTIALGVLMFHLG